MTKMELINEEFIGIRFQFDKSLVKGIRGLDCRRWNPKKKRWEVHIAHLAEVAKIFSLHPKDIPPEIVSAYQCKWIKIWLQVNIQNTMTRLSGKSIPVEEIDTATSFPVHGHQYSPKFLSGSWDGRKHLFDKRTYSFPTGLLDRVLNILDKHAVRYCVTDQRTASTSSIPSMNPEVALRDYQEEAIKAALTHKRGVLEMATGSGKTTVAAHLIATLKRPCLFFVHTKDLLYQTRDYFATMLGKRIGQVGDGVVDIKPITVATIQSTARALGGDYAKNFDGEIEEEDETDVAAFREKIVKQVEQVPLVFFDECHHVPAETCYTVAMRTYCADYRFGLSATPYRADRHDLLLEAALGPKIYRANASALIDKGYLVPPEIFFLSAPNYKSTVKALEYQQIVQKYIVENQKRNELIIEEARKLNQQGLSVLILVSQVRHGEQLKALLPEAKFVQGEDASAIRNAALRHLRDRSLLTLIATTLADEGLDVPTLNAVILASGGKSETKALQRLGRALRPAPHKKKAIIIDFFDNAPYLKEHSMRRLEIFRTEPRFTIRTVGFEC
jgi:superfamily II DNA or RNA helicase